MLYENDSTSYNCPQCAAPLNFHFKYSKLIKCASCDSSIFLEDKHVKLIGQSSVLSPIPSLIKLYQNFKLQGKTFTPLGKIRYSYGRGFWEEWFLKDERNQEFWLSIDEGDFVLQEKVKLSLPFKSASAFKLGRKYGQYLVTEKGEGTCVGFEGELPANINTHQKHHYIHLSLGQGNLVTAEFTKDLTETFKGKWIDPLDIEVLG
jgi:DNA-directed RNA polymerase subunit RPC12/RpoP